MARRVALSALRHLSERASPSSAGLLAGFAGGASRVSGASDIPTPVHAAAAGLSSLACSISVHTQGLGSSRRLLARVFSSDAAGVGGGITVGGVKISPPKARKPARAAGDGAPAGPVVAHVAAAAAAAGGAGAGAGASGAGARQQQQQLPSAEAIGSVVRLEEAEPDFAPTQLTGFGSGVVGVNDVFFHGSVVALPHVAFLWSPTSWDEVTAESLAFLRFLHPLPGAFALVPSLVPSRLAPFRTLSSSPRVTSLTDCTSSAHLPLPIIPTHPLPCPQTT